MSGSQKVYSVEVNSSKIYKWVAASFCSVGNGNATGNYKDVFVVVLLWFECEGSFTKVH